VPQENHKITSVCQQRMSLCNKEEKKDAPIDILGSRPSLVSSNSLAAMSIAFFLVTCIFPFIYGESLLQSNINKFINFHVDNQRYKNYKKVDMWYLWKIHLHKNVWDSSLFLCAKNHPFRPKSWLSDSSPTECIRQRLSKQLVQRTYLN